MFLVSVNFHYPLQLLHEHCYGNDIAPKAVCPHQHMGRKNQGDDTKGKKS